MQEITLEILFAPFPATNTNCEFPTDNSKFRITNKMTGENQQDMIYQEQPQYYGQPPQYAPVPQNYGAGYQAGGVYQQQTTIGVSQQDTALIIQIAILIIGWFCCCVWAAGFAYVKHPNPNVALMAKINAALFLFGICMFCISMIILVVYIIVISLALS